MIPELNGDFLQWLRGFYYVAKTGSVRRAAELMHRNPSTISYQLRSLETELNTVLFDRYKKSLQITPEGKKLLGTQLKGVSALLDRLAVECRSEICCDEEKQKELFERVADEVGLIKIEEERYCRHPLVYLMEAADDICYQIMDIEDANQKQWLTLDKLKYYINKDENISLDIKNKLMQNTQTTSGNNNYSKKEWVSFRTTLLSHLMEVATNNFVEKLGDIVRGEYNNELIEDNDGVAKLLKYITREYILSNREITSLEITGEAVISGILNAYIKYFFHTNKDFRDRGKSLISRSIFMTILHEHKEAYHDDSYFVQKYGNYQSIEKLYKNFDVADFTVEERFRLIRDFIACMTDKFALNHIRKLNGQKI